MMLVQLQETDRVLVEYNPSGEEEGVTLLVTFDGQHDIYHLLMREVSGETLILWRGSFSVVWKKFSEEVDTFEHDIQLERNPNTVDEVMA
jgi:hypothetical protein